MKSKRLQWYRTLLRLYPKPFRDRFADGMAQTFADLVRERGGGGYVLWLFLETLMGIARERATGALRLVEYTALAVAALLVAGIVTVMVLARGTGEDITGVVAPALLLTVLALATAVIAARRRRAVVWTRDNAEHD